MARANALFVLGIAALALARKAPPSKARAKREIKTAVRSKLLGARVGQDRLRGNLLEAAGLATGATMVYAGAALPTQALWLQSAVVADKGLEQLWPAHKTLLAADKAVAAMVCGAAMLHLPVTAGLVPWLIIGGIAARTGRGVANATSFEPATKAALQHDLPPLAAAAGFAATTSALARVSGVSAGMVASALLGGLLVVESSLCHLRNEFDQIAIAAIGTVKPLLQGSLKPVAGPLRALRRVLLPLPKLVRNKLDLVKTGLQSAVGVAEAQFAQRTPPQKAAIAASVGIATQVPVVGGAATQIVSKTVGAQIGERFQRALPAVLQEKNVTGRVRDAAARFEPLTLARSAWAGGRALLQRSARWLLPVYFAAWGCAVQAGKLGWRDTPQALSYLLPLKWAEIVPEPLGWVLGTTKKAYSKVLVDPAKRLVTGSAKGVGKGVGTVVRSKPKEAEAL